MRRNASRVVAVFALIAAVSGCSKSDNNVIAPAYGVYVATEDGIGAYTFRIDPNSGMLISGSPFAAGRSVKSILQLKSRLYAIEAMDNEYQLVTYEIDRNTGVLSFLGRISVPGDGMVLDPAGETIYIVSSVSSEEESRFVLGLALDPVTGMPAPLPGNPIFIGTNRDCWASACAVRRVTVHPSGRFIYARGSGVERDNYNRPIDSIFVLSRNTSTGALEAVPGSPFSLFESASNYRYDLLVHPSGEYFYSAGIGCCDTGVDIFRIDQETSALFLVDSIKERSGGTTTNRGATLHPLGQWFYLQQDSDWGTGSILYYRVDSQSGRLSLEHDEYKEITSYGNIGFSKLVFHGSGGIALLERWTLWLEAFWVESSTGNLSTLTTDTPGRLYGARYVTFSEDQRMFACVYVDEPDYRGHMDDHMDDSPTLLKAFFVDVVPRSYVDLNAQGLAVGRNPSGIAVATLSP